MHKHNSNGSLFYTDCSNYSPGNSSSSFRVFSSGLNFDFTCVAPLIWSQDNCRCEPKPVIITDPDCPHHRPVPGQPTQFQKRARGEWVETPFNCPELLVWDQSQCRCEWGPGEPRASGGLTGNSVTQACLVKFISYDLGKRIFDRQNERRRN